MQVSLPNLGTHRSAVAALRPRPLSRLRPSTDDDVEQDQCQATLLRLLSITEAFAAELLYRKVDEAIAGASGPAALKVAEDAAIRGTASWKDQQKAYKDWFGVEVNWKAVERLAEARNAVAHGLGRLTRRQRRNEASVRGKLKEIGIEVDGYRVMLSDSTLASAASACRDFVEKLDLAAHATT